MELNPFLLGPGSVSMTAPCPAATAARRKQPRWVWRYT